MIKTPIMYPRNPEVIAPGIERLKVPGGWIVSFLFAQDDVDSELYKSTSRPQFSEISGSIVFVPDKNYTWILETSKRPPVND